MTLELILVRYTHGRMVDHLEDTLVRVQETNNRCFRMKTRVDHEDESQVGTCMPRAHPRGIDHLVPSRRVPRVGYQVEACSLRMALQSTICHLFR